MPVADALWLCCAGVGSRYEYDSRLSLIWKIRSRIAVERSLLASFLGSVEIGQLSLFKAFRSRKVVGYSGLDRENSCSCGCTCRGG